MVSIKPIDLLPRVYFGKGHCVGLTKMFQAIISMAMSDTFSSLSTWKLFLPPRSSKGSEKLHMASYRSRTSGRFVFGSHRIIVILFRALVDSHASQEEEVLPPSQEVVLVGYVAFPLVCSLLEELLERRVGSVNDARVSCRGGGSHGESEKRKAKAV